MTSANGSVQFSITGRDDGGTASMSRYTSVGFGSWSPDGQYLLVARGKEAARRDLWIIDIKGNVVGQVTDGPADYGMYAWGPGDRR